MYKLRYYQQEASNIAVEHLRNYGKPFVVVVATGGGKSLILADICHQLNEPVLILQPTKEILCQNYEKLKSYGIEDISMYSASMNSKEISKYTYATIGSIYRKPELFKHFKFIIVDEVHGVNPKHLGGMYSKFFKEINCNNICGLTATPYRLDSKFFKDDTGTYYTSTLKMINRIYPFMFKKIVYKKETQELINEGYLCPIKYYADEVDLSKLEVNSTGRDYTEKSLKIFWNNQRLERLGKVIQHIDKNCKCNLIFCSSIAQAKKSKEILDKNNINSEIVTGDTPDKERSEIVQQFRDGRLKHMINVGCFVVGLDIPQLDSIVMARPTMSLALYYQVLGRGIRKDPDRPDKVLKFYDLAGVVKRMGRVETIRIVKEDDGFRDKVVSERGDMTNVPLFTFKVTKKEKTEKLKTLFN